MEKNKTGRYFKYAFGEIILVVIGILIALSINNWNENRKLEIIKQDYLYSLLADLKEDSLKIENRINFSKVRMVEYENYEKPCIHLKLFKKLLKPYQK